MKAQVQFPAEAWEVHHEISRDGKLVGSHKRLSKRNEDLNLYCLLVQIATIKGD